MISLLLSWMPFLYGTLIRGFAISLLILFVVRLLSHRGANWRHTLLLGGLAALAVAPILAALLPPLTADPAPITTSRPSVLQIAAQVPLASHPIVVPSYAPRVWQDVHPSVRWEVLLPVVYLLGLLCLTARFVIVYLRGRRLVSRSTEFTDTTLGGFEWGQAKVRILPRGAGEIPMAWGWRQPVVLLPSSAATWSKERLALTLHHELSHIQRGDWLVNLAGQAVIALYWPNPLVWLLVRQIHDAAEAAADEEVVARGIDPKIYAFELVQIASEARRQNRLAVSMARTPRVEGRVRAILANRPSVRRSTLGVLAGVCLAITGCVPLMAFQGKPMPRSSTVSSKLLAESPKHMFSDGTEVALVATSDEEDFPKNRSWDVHGATLEEELPFARYRSAHIERDSVRFVLLAIKTKQAADCSVWAYQASEEGRPELARWKGGFSEVVQTGAVRAGEETTVGLSFNQFVEAKSPLVIALATGPWKSALRFPNLWSNLVDGYKPEDQIQAVRTPDYFGVARNVHGNINVHPIVDIKPLRLGSDAVKVVGYDAKGDTVCQVFGFDVLSSDQLRRIATFEILRRSYEKASFPFAYAPKKALTHPDIPYLTGRETQTRPQDSVLIPNLASVRLAGVAGFRSVDGMGRLYGWWRGDGKLMARSPDGSQAGPLSPLSLPEGYCPYVKVDWASGERDAQADVQIEKDGKVLGRFTVQPGNSSMGQILAPTSITVDLSVRIDRPGGFDILKEVPITAEMAVAPGGVFFPENFENHSIELRYQAGRKMHREELLTGLPPDRAIRLWAVKRNGDLTPLWEASQQLNEHTEPGIHDVTKIQIRAYKQELVRFTGVQTRPVFN